MWRDKQGGETAQRSLWAKLEHLEGGPQGIPCAEGGNAIPWLVPPSVEEEEAKDSLPVSIAYHCQTDALSSSDGAPDRGFFLPQ